MRKLIEGTHYMRRHEQPTHAPHNSKKIVDNLLCSDSGDDDDAQVGMFARKGQLRLGKQNRLTRPPKDAYILILMVTILKN